MKIDPENKASEDTGKKVYCTPKFIGFCENINSIQIFADTSKSYSVQECYELCLTTTLGECAEFIRTKQGYCYLIKPGCVQNSGTDVFNGQIYSMNGCSSEKDGTLACFQIKKNSAFLV